MKKALYYKTLENGVVKCKLCPHYCLIGDNEHGLCNVRINREGNLYSEFFEKVTAIGLDPIEKKPLYHFYPGSTILSVGSLGCTMRCLFCQNYRLSHPTPQSYDDTNLFTVKAIVKMAIEQKNNIGIAFTYNEPGTFYEYMINVAMKAKPEGLKTVMVTNGYINREPLEAIIPYIDVFNVDLKAFSESFYKSITSSRLAPVKKTISRIASSQKHLEITNLVIPGMNDNYAEFEEMVRWIASETGDRTVLHISRYFPNFQMQISSTPINILLDLYEIAKKHLRYVYLGNVFDIAKDTTYCDQCFSTLIIREPGKIMITGLDKLGNCTNCGNHVLDHVYYKPQK
jgi:pyruvate formate lyase activating enzyme